MRASLWCTMLWVSIAGGISTPAHAEGPTTAASTATPAPTTQANPNAIPTYFGMPAGLIHSVELQRIVNNESQYPEATRAQCDAKYADALKNLQDLAQQICSKQTDAQAGTQKMADIINTVNATCRQTLPDEGRALLRTLTSVSTQISLLTTSNQYPDMSMLHLSADQAQSVNQILRKHFTAFYKITHPTRSANVTPEIVGEQIYEEAMRARAALAGVFTHEQLLLWNQQKFTRDDDGPTYIIPKKTTH